MESGKTEEDFYKTIEELLGIPKDQLNDFIRKDLALMFTD